MDNEEFTVLHYVGGPETRPKWSHGGYSSPWYAEVAAQWAIDYGPTTYVEIRNEDDEVINTIGDPHDQNS